MVRNAAKVKKDSLHIYLSPDVGKRLYKLAADQQRSITGQIEFILKLYLDKEEYDRTRDGAEDKAVRRERTRLEE